MGEQSKNDAENVTKTVRCKEGLLGLRGQNTKNNKNNDLARFLGTNQERGVNSLYENILIYAYCRT